MSQIDNKVAAILMASEKAFATAEANTGEGLSGDWPPEGDHDCYVIGVTMNEGKFKEKGGAEIPCAEIRFEYHVIKDPSDPNFRADAPPQIFKGERFQLVKDDYPFATEGSRTRNRIGWDRFKGHISKMLGKDPRAMGNVMIEFNDLVTQLKDKRIAVRLRAQYRSSQDGKAVYKTEFIVDRLS